MSIELDARTRRLVTRARESIEKGVLPAALVADPRLYNLEAERVFARSWTFLAHETEVPNPGDYVVRYLGGSSVIVVRAGDGTVRAMGNSCRHRGTQLCRTDMGNTSHFRCPYHGWTYRNTGELVGVPAQQRVYGAVMDKARWSLTQVPKLDSYNGLIFGCADDSAPALEDYLGDMRWYIDLFTQRSAAGLEVRGEPQRWVVDANWKLGSDNFVGDAYHTLMTHRSMSELGVLPGNPEIASAPAHVSLPNGHGLGVLGVPPGFQMPPFMGYPDQMVAGMAEGYDDEAKLAVLKQTIFIHGTIFPNLSFLNVLMGRDGQQSPEPMLTLRMWRPLAHDSMEVWSWFLVEKDAPEEFKQASYDTYVRTFGVSGVLEQDDAEIWRLITRGTQGELCGGQDLNFEMGLGVIGEQPDWPGPGRALASGYAEQNQRAFWGRWLELLSDDSNIDTVDTDGELA